MPDTRDAIFDRLLVDHMVRGTTRVSWRYRPNFVDPGPWSAQLFVGATGDDHADDWAATGPAQLNVNVLADAGVRASGSPPTVHYRVVVTTPLGAYTSHPAACWGALGKHDWLIARDIVRKEGLRGRLALVPGRLLPQRHAGPAPADVDPPAAAAVLVDPILGTPLSRAAVETAGTAFERGYFRPVPAALEVSGDSWYPRGDPRGGNVDDGASGLAGRMLLLPQVARGDLFLADGSDLRHMIHQVAVVAAWRGVPLVGQVGLRRLEPGDVAYRIDPAAL